ncbi:MAG: hypothetical protein A2020_13350 [Lentisphaerae bacterium GWF2_45_14]|nr:MAG: hypothetical protein A2020_13350 [Lentisphaerae bacterium GWF2_45_14]
MALYLGIDASTQGIKAELIDTAKGEIITSFGINFGKDLPHFKSTDGFLENADPTIRHANPLMWLEGLDMLFSQMQKKGAPLSDVAGISGSAQQHGSVYLKNNFPEILAKLDSDKNLSEQLKISLSRQTSPIWMDRSTSAECDELYARFGERIQSDTGSPAIERFTGPQIRRFAKAEPENYDKTSVIHLVSSFLCSVLCGNSAPIDYADGSGMNLLNIKELDWDREITSFTAPDLLKKLPAVVDPSSIAGNLSNYFSKYGLNAGIPVQVWSGDNPNSLIGVGAAMPGSAVISLGSSDTFFAAMRNFKTDKAGCGHVFCNPAGGFMSLICFSNGSLARERIKTLCKVDWEFFDRTAGEMTRAGNNGKLMLPYFEPESTPKVLTPGVKRNYSNAEPAEEIRTIMESQAISMKIHSEWQQEDFKKIRITGGASGSQAFRKILADVFQAEIESISIKNSAALGAALRVANAVGEIPFHKLFDIFCVPNEVIKPDSANAKVYKDASSRYVEFEKINTSL